MENTISIKAPAISAVDKDGVQWTFDPAAQKWTATFEGKKFHSQDYSKVRDKMHEHRLNLKSTAEGKSKPAPVAPVIQTLEVGLLAISFDSNGNQPIDFTKEKIKVEPMTVKLEWNTKTGEPTVLRFKGKDGGWNSSGAGSLILVHPNFMDGTMRKFFERSIEGRMLNNTFVEAEKQIAQAWWNAKEETRETYSIGMHGFTKDARAYYDRHSSRGSIVSSSWPLTVPQKIDTPTFEEWQAQEDGSLRRGDVVVKMHPQQSGLSGLVFQVFAPGYEEAVFTNGDLRTTLLIGNATHEMLATPDREPVLTWQGGYEWTENVRQSSWPKLMEVHWAAAMPHKDMHRSGYAPMTYFFGRLPNEAKKDRIYSNETDPHETMWHRTDAMSSYGGRSYRLAGPEDRALDCMRALAGKFDRMAENNDLVEISREDIRELFKGTLSDVYNASIDGEEEISKDPSNAKAAFDNLVKNLQGKIEARGLTTKWKEECASTVQAVQEIVSTPPASTPKKAPKPR